jgi:hypothetical protein
MDTRSSRSHSATTVESDLRMKFLDEVEDLWPGATRAVRLIEQHDEWLKRKHTDGHSWYDIITENLSENWHDDDDAQFAYDSD